METEIADAKQIIAICRNSIANGTPQLKLDYELQGKLTLMRKELKVISDLFCQYSDLRDLLGSHRYSALRELSKIRGEVTTILAMLPQFYPIGDNKSIVYQEMRMYIEDRIENIGKIWKSIDTVLNTIE